MAVVAASDEPEVLGVPPVVAAGLAVLEGLPPLSGSPEWNEFVAGLRAFDDP
jgi:hypothetical protein